MIVVTIPVYKPDAVVFDLISSILSQDVKCKILLIDSSPEINFELSKLDKIDYYKIKEDDFNHGSTRNLAMFKYPMADVYVFMTQDAVLSGFSSLRKLTDPILKSNAEAAYGRQIADKEVSLVDYLDRSSNYPSESRVKSIRDISELGIKVYFFSNAFSAVCGKLFREIGGFPEQVIMNEDMILSSEIINSGGKIMYVSDAIVHHTHNYSPAKVFKRYFDHGVFFSLEGSRFKVSKVSDSGIKHALIAMRKFIELGDLKHLVKYTIITLAKFFGYKAGKCHTRLPRKLIIRLSMHTRYWLGQS